jgi:hypothetical protein
MIIFNKGSNYRDICKIPSNHEELTRKWGRFKGPKAGKDLWNQEASPVDRHLRKLIDLQNRDSVSPN